MDLDLIGDGDLDYFLELLLGEILLFFTYFMPAFRLSTDLAFFLLTNFELALFDLSYRL